MKKVIFIFMMMFVAGACTPIQEEEYRSPYYMTEEENQKINEEVCRLQEPVRDLDARYWAGRIVAGDVTYEELAAAIREGMHTMRESARRLVLDGTTSLSELQRISVEEQNEAGRETACPFHSGASA